MDEVTIWVRDTNTVFARFPVSDIKFMDIYQDGKGHYKFRVFLNSDGFETAFDLSTFTFCHSWEVPEDDSSIGNKSN